MPIPRVAAAFAALCMAVVAGGCIDSTTTVDVNPDGSGTVTEALYVTRPMERMLGVMSGMAAALMNTDTNAAAAVSTGAVDRVKFQSRAAGMGSNIRLVSVERVARRDGLGGLRAVYAFADVRQLRLPVDPPYPVPDFGVATSGETARVTFGFAGGPTPVLTLSIPWAETARQSVATRQLSRPTGTASTDESSLLRHMLDGFRARMVVTTPKGIAGTDGAFTESSASADGRRSAVLFDLDMGTLVRNEALLDQLSSLGPSKDMGDALGRYAGLPGLKIETRSTVRVRLKI